MGVDSHVPQVSEFLFDPCVVVTARRTGHDTVERCEPCEVVTKGVPIITSLPHRPPAKSIMYLIDAVEMPRTPTQEVPKEEVGRLCGVFGAESAFNRDPAIVMQLLLFFISQTHKQPVLDLLALGQWAAGSVQALEYLLRVFRFAESDTDHAESLKPLEQSGRSMPGDQAARDSPTLGHGSGTGRAAFETASVFFLIPILKPQLPALFGWLSWIRQPIITDDLSGPVARSARADLVRDAGQEDAHRRQPLLAVHNPDSLHDSRRARLGEREEGAAVMRRVGAAVRDGHEVLNQPLNVGLPPTIATLPTWNDVLNLSVQKFKKLDLLRLHKASQ